MTFKPRMMTFQSMLPARVINVVLFGLLAVASGGWAQTMSRRESPGVGPASTVLLTDFANSTGNALLDGSVRQAVSVALSQSPLLNVFTMSDAFAPESTAPAPGVAPSNANIEGPLCNPDRAKGIVTGALAPHGGRVTIHLRVLSCANSKRLADAESESTLPDILESVSRATRQIRSQLGESAVNIQRFDAPLSNASSASFEALQAMSLAVDTERTQGAPAELPHLERAIQLDAQFAAAISRAAKIYRNLGQETKAVDYMSRAFELRARATQRERYQIETDYFSFASGEYEQGVAGYLAWIKDYPLDARPHVNLGSLYGDVAEYSKATLEFSAALRLDPRHLIAHEDLVEILMLNDRFEAMRQDYERMMQLGLDDDSPHVEMYAVDFLQHNLSALAREVAWFDGKPSYEHEILAQEADSAAYMGRLANARALTARAVASALRTENREQAAGWLLNSAWREEVFGNETTAREQATQALAMVPNSRENAAVAAIILARTGNSAEAQKIEHDLNARYGRNVSVQRYWLPCIRAQIALSAHRFVAAVQELQVSRPYDALYPQVTNSSHAFSVVLRAEAYRGLGQEKNARREWQYILKHPGPISLSATGPLARLQIARSFSIGESAGMKGRQDTSSIMKGRAGTAYEKFLSEWKSADSDIPILRQARSEYEALRRARPRDGKSQEP